MALASASDAYDYLPGLASGEDAKVNKVIARVESAIAAYLGFRPAAAAGDVTLDSTSYTLYSRDGWLHVSAENGRKLILPYAPCTSVTTLHDDSLWAYGASTLVASSDYTLEGDLGHIWLDPDASHAWTAAPRNIKAVVVCGWSTAPDSLLEAICRHTARTWEAWKTAGSLNIVAGPSSKTLRLPKFDEDVLELLGPYRQPAFWLS